MAVRNALHLGHPDPAKIASLDEFSKRMTIRRRMSRTDFHHATIDELDA